MTVQRTWSGERAVTVAGLVVGAARQERDRQFDPRCPQSRDTIGVQHSAGRRVVRRTGPVAVSKDRT
jgi:hypothetical protein